MKKLVKNSRKLNISTETIVNLTYNDLVNVAGGSKASACSCDTTVPGAVDPHSSNTNCFGCNPTLIPAG